MAWRLPSWFLPLSPWRIIYLISKKRIISTYRKDDYNKLMQGTLNSKKLKMKLKEYILPLLFILIYSKNIISLKSLIRSLNLLISYFKIHGLKYWCWDNEKNPTNPITVFSIWKRQLASHLQGKWNQSWCQKNYTYTQFQNNKYCLHGKPKKKKWDSFTVQRIQYT